MVKTSQTYNTVIIGGGFYGLRIAQFLREDLGVKNVIVIEKDPTVMSRASYNNQARVHNGYHYPRSILTALRSRVNLPVFAKEYEEAVVNNFDKYYAVAHHFSHVDARQYKRFFERINADIVEAPEVSHLFNPKLIDAVFKVKEYAFNSVKLRDQLLKRLADLDVQVHTGEEVADVYKSSAGLEVITDKSTYATKFVINASYSSINILNEKIGLPIIPLKHELTEMCLVSVPEAFKNKAFTIMCGPFFSLMPFPDKDLYTLSHVRYTPHTEWVDLDNEEVRHGHKYQSNTAAQSHFEHMLADTKRYMPDAKGITYSGESLWEVKTVLQTSESDDSRPILYKTHHGGLKGYICIMGGKIDNIYDVFRELRITYAD